ncbi:MAG TPA: GIY-YIG nuclease family protein [Candidatus Paceibacterota bacterium]
MGHIVYVLRDELGTLYKGMTNNLGRRLQEHGRGSTKTTAKMKKPTVAYAEEFDTFEAARKRELYFKTAAGRRFLKKKLGP